MVFLKLLTSPAHLGEIFCWKHLLQELSGENRPKNRHNVWIINVTIKRSILYNLIIVFQFTAGFSDQCYFFEI